MLMSPSPGGECEVGSGPRVKGRLANPGSWKESVAGVDLLCVQSADVGTHGSWRSQDGGRACMAGMAGMTRARAPPPPAGRQKPGIVPLLFWSTSLPLIVA